MRQCPRCLEDQPDDFFILDDAGEACDICASTAGTRTPIGLRRCDRCDERKPGTAFRGTRRYCIPCEGIERRNRKAQKKRDAKFFFLNGDHRDCPTCKRIMLSCRCPPPPPPTSKVCPGCTTPLLFAAFGLDPHRKDGRRTYCYQCEAEKRKDQRAANARRVGHTAVVTGSDRDADPADSLAPAQASYEIELPLREDLSQVSGDVPV